MPERVFEYDYTSVPTIRDFSRSQAFMRALVGPFGSGKSSGCVIDLLRQSQEQAPGPDGVRRTRHVVVRNTYSQLQDTTIKTFHDWLPPDIFGTYEKSYHNYTVTAFPGVHMEIMFRALDRPDHVAKLLSAEYTSGWVNEAREVPWSVIDALQGRVGRYPARRDGGATRYGIILDTNPPDTDSAFYRYFEEEKPKNAQVFHQPSGRDPKAENLANLPKDYYQNLAIGKDPDFIKVYIDGLYGYVRDGKPVYPEFNDTIHVGECQPIPGKPIRRGWDFGLTPACSFSQMLPDGRWIVFDELCADSLGIDRFSDTVLHHVSQHYGTWKFEDFGDPAGNQRAQTDEKTCFEILRGKGINIQPGEVSDSARIEAVKKPLNSLVSGKPGFMLHPRCKMLRKGFIGKYRYRRLQGAGERYMDSPEKNEYSHCFVAGTMVETDRGLVTIESIHTGMMVATPFGYRQVTATMRREAAALIDVVLSNGGTIRCTPDHPFWVEDGFIRADALPYGAILSRSPSWEGQRSIESKNSMESVTTGSKAATSKPSPHTAETTCIGRSGSSIMELFRMAFASTISTTTAGITTSGILFSCPTPTMPATTEKSGQREILNVLHGIWPQSGLSPQNGTVRQRASNGIRGMVRRLLRPPQFLRTAASNVALNIKLRKALGRLGIALPDAWLRLAAHAELTMRIESALSAPRYSGSTVTPKPVPAVSVVELRSVNGGAKVYDLTVEDAHCFYAGGVLVSNCHDALQYDASRLFGATLRNMSTDMKPIKYPKLGLV